MSNSLKIPTYKILAARISTNTSPKSLLIQATSIRSVVKKQLAPRGYLILAKKSECKAQYLMPLEITLAHCPAPTKYFDLECIAYKKYTFATTVMRNIGCYPIYRKQIREVGYAAILAKQVEKQVASPVYHELRAQGSVKMSAEYFIYKHGIQLVSADVYTQISSLFEPENIALKLLPQQVAMAA